MQAVFQPDMMAGAAPNPMSADKFTKLVNQNCEGQLDTYVGGPSQAAASKENALVNMMSKVQNLDLGKTNEARAGESEEDNAASYDDARGDMSPAENLEHFGSVALQMQRELFKTTVMLEGVNGLQKGTSTLFQLQG